MFAQHHWCKNIFCIILSFSFSSQNQIKHMKIDMGVVTHVNFDSDCALKATHNRQFWAWMPKPDIIMHPPGPISKAMAPKGTDAVGSFSRKKIWMVKLAS
jgi:hypothetical protein